MGFVEFWLGCFGTAVLLLMVMPMTFERERPVVTLLIATAAVVLIIMPMLYLVVWYLLGGVL